MDTGKRLIKTLLTSAIGIAVMVLFATVAFYIIIFVVSTGANLGGHDPSGDYIVLSSALIVVAVILTGGLTPRLSQPDETTSAEGESSDPTYN